MTVNLVGQKHCYSLIRIIGKGRREQEGEGVIKGNCEERGRFAVVL